MMLAVNSEHIPSPMQHTAEEYQEEPSLSEAEVAPLKQQAKRKLLTPLNILIILSALTLIGLGSYFLIAQSSAKDIQNKINESHDKIISYADSSSQKDGSSTGSSSSKSSSNNNKPNQRSTPAGKKVISSNNKLTGAGSPPNGDDEDDRDDNSEKKKNSMSGGSSTEIDSEEESEEDSIDDMEQDPKVWVDTKAPGVTAGTPNVGATRDGGN